METLVILILSIPIICSLLACIFRSFPKIMKIAIIAISIVPFILCYKLVTIFMNSNSSFMLISIADIVKLNVEPVGLIFITMASFLWSVTNLYSWSYLKSNPEINQSKFFFFLSISMFCTFALAFAKDLISTFIFYEFLTILTYPLVANNGTEHERHSSKKYISILLGASMVLFLPAILIILHQVGHTDFAIGGIMSNLEGLFLAILFIMFLYGVAKTAIVPMHSWLPEAMVAPIPVSAILHAVAVVKAGIFVVLKIIIYTFGIETLQGLVINTFNNINVITLLCAASLLISSVIALYQTTMKKLLAYSTINQLSICLLAASMFHPIAIKAAILHMISHAFGKICLFFAAGYVYCNAKITDIKDYGGLGMKMKITMAIFTICSLSIVGIPIFSGFVSKSYVLFAALSNGINYIVIAVITISILTTSHYFIKIINTIYYQPKTLDGIEKRVIYHEAKSSSMVIAMFIACIGVVIYFWLYGYIINVIDLIPYYK